MKKERTSKKYCGECGFKIRKDKESHEKGDCHQKHKKNI